MNNIEYRNIQTDLTTDENSRTVHGLAIPINSRSELLGGEFYETITADAITDAFIKSQDVKLYLDHDPSHGTFARSKFGSGSLRLYVTERGLEFTTDIPNTVFGDALLEGIRRGDYDAISFAFLPKEEKWANNNDGTYERTITKFELLDECSILSQLPAYSATSVDIRSLSDFKEDEKRHIEELNNKLDNIMKEIDEKSNIFS